MSPSAKHSRSNHNCLHALASPRSLSMRASNGMPLNELAKKFAELGVDVNLRSYSIVVNIFKIILKSKPGS